MMESQYIIAIISSFVIPLIVSLFVNIYISNGRY